MVCRICNELLHNADLVSNIRVIKNLDVWSQKALIHFEKCYLKDMNDAEKQDKFK